MPEFTFGIERLLGVNTVREFELSVLSIVVVQTAIQVVV
jgi:hypothetical protein